MDFSQTIGHKKKKTLFEQAVRNQRLFHAYVFAGPEHIGKTTFALELAKNLGAHPVLDVKMFDNPDGLQISEARELQDRLSLTPVGEIKVVIITYAERMTAQAANSLLKVLEEPPAHSLLLLTVNNFSALLPTISSRVQRVNFFPGTDEDVEKILEPRSLSVERKRQIVKLAQGRVGFALRLAAEENVFSEHAQALRYFHILENGSLVERLKAAEEFAATPRLAADFLKIAMIQWVQKLSDPQVANRLLKAYRDIERNLNSKLIFDNLFLL